jgi:hypothetical protein
VVRFAPTEDAIQGVVYDREEALVELVRQTMIAGADRLDELFVRRTGAPTTLYGSEVRWSLSRWGTRTHE